jgi:hypothetical protein
MHQSHVSASPTRYSKSERQGMFSERRAVEGHEQQAVTTGASAR